jgi:hypothetical protein
MPVSAFVSEFEWQASNAYRYYPFVDPADEDGRELRGLIVDALVTSPSAEVRLTELKRDGDEWLIGLEGTDPDWTRQTTMWARPYGPWTILTGDGARLVLRTEAIDGDEYAVGDARFVPHVLQTEPLRVTSVKVNGQKLSGPVELLAGYNIDFGIGTRGSGVRTSVPVTLNVRPGAGLGLEPCPATICDSPIKTINHIGPNANGDFALEGVDCYNIVPDLARSGLEDGLAMADGRLRMLSSCSPCCDCSDYGFVYGEVLGALLDRAKLLAERHADLRRRYQELVAELDRIAACRSTPTIELVATGMYGRTVSVAMGFKNNSDAPWPSAAEWVEVAIAPAARARLVQGSAQLHDGGAGRTLQYEYAAGDPLFRFRLPPVPCCSTWWASFDLVWHGIGSFVSFVIASSGELDGVTYNLNATGATKAPVNRDRS